ncbi:MAG TPA: AAA family ATPase, partial [Nakamurella sp.]
MTPFVGRRAELGVLRACLDDARAGRPRMVLIEGPAGIGKTALLDRLATDCARDPAVVVLRASGDENEELLAYGLLRQLVRSAGPEAPQLVPQANGRLLPDGAPLADPITVGTGYLQFLDSLAGSVLVLIVDDVLWADRPSVQALVFALRRLVADRVLAVFATREEGVDALPESLARLVAGHLGTVLRLSGLDEQELRDLAAAMGVDGVGATVARRLRGGTNGNPLHARALLEEFPVSDWPVNRQDDSLLPPPRSFRHLVRGRYDGSEDGTRRFVDGLAVLGLHASVADVAATAGLADPVGAIDEATANDLLRVRQADGPWSVEFTHPLVRAAVYDAIPPSRRHALHTAAARLSSDETAVLRHRVAAATGPDEELAADLTDFAERAQRRFDWKSAAVHLVSASRLSLEPSRARRRVLWALIWTLLRGDAAAAGDLTDEVASYPPDLLRDLVLGSLAIAAEEPDRAGKLLDRAWAACESGSAPVDSAIGRTVDPQDVAAVALMQAIHRYGRLDANGTVLWCERALSAIGDRDTGAPRTGPGTSIHAVAVTYLAHGLGYAGRRVEAQAAARPSGRPPDETQQLWLSPRSAQGVLHLIDDEYDSAVAVLRSVAATASRLGILNTAAFSYAYLARAQWMAGDWDDAQVNADRAVAINLESDFGFLRSAVVGIAVLVPGARGDWAVAEQNLRLLPRSQVHYERSVVALGMARARVGEARGRPNEVLAALDPVRLFPDRDAVDEPGFWPWVDLYADALVAVGRAPEADLFLASHERRAEESARATSIARLARARGRVEQALGRSDSARSALDRALELVGSVRAPFERARIELAAGEVLRRTGNRRRAVELLMSARGGFLGLGAAPYADRCDGELAAAGLATAARPGRVRFGLTAQELVVARQAANGLSNRQIAGELVVSIKTVEYHLRNAFAKLG